MAKIIIKWKSQCIGCACKFDVYLMNTYIGELKCGKSIEISADVGCHTLYFKQKIKLGKKADTSFEAVINDESEIVLLKAKFNFNGNFVVSYADNAPHILTTPAINCADNTPHSPINTDVNSAGSGGKINEINNTLTDIKKETKKTNGCLGGCLTFIIVIFVIGFIFSAIFRESIKPDSATISDQTTEETNQENKDNAEEDKVLYSDDRFKITFVNLVDMKTGITMYNMNLKLENNSNKNVMIQLEDAYINDTKITFLGGNADFDGTAPGKKSICAFAFGYANTGINSIEDVKKMEFKIKLTNSDKYSETLLSTDTITLNFN